MGYRNLHEWAGALWELAGAQHGVVSRSQLLELGMHPQAVKHRVAAGRLHPVGRGVYAVGRPKVTRRGEWMAAVLSCGPNALLSHVSAAALWEIRAEGRAAVHVTVPARARRCRSGIVVHRHDLAPAHRASHDGIPVTSPACTILGLAGSRGTGELEAAINEADKLDLIDPESLRAAAEGFAGRTGAPCLRATLDRRTFKLTDSALERRFRPIVRSAGLPPPETGRVVNGFKVDFFWPALWLVVETDGLRYHRTPAQQARDHRRDQVHYAAGFQPLRFTHAQVAYESGHVKATLAAALRRQTGSRTIR